MPILPLTTARLRLRVMRPADAAHLAAYRNDPEIARYQDWDLPYSITDAERMLADQSGIDDVTVDEWIQIAIDVLDSADGPAMVGDLALGLVGGGHVAHLGYTLAPEHQGHGYAAEAAGALVDALFEHTSVHRIVATLDPENHASMRVVEQLGFVWEGTAREAELIRGEWLDDMRFALLERERAAWLARPTSFEHVDLVEVTEHNLVAVASLQTHRHQRRFVAPMERSLAQALVPPMHAGHPVVPWFRAVRADGEIVGFMMLSAVSPGEPVPYLWRFLIDRHHQRRGVGAAAMRALTDHLRAEGHEALLLSWVDGPGGPRRFYERLGFVATGEIDDGEVVARLAL